jgi:hypothetical protein
MMGSDSLAAVHEDIAMDVPGLDDDARWTIILSRAERVSNHEKLWLMQGGGWGEV